MNFLKDKKILLIVTGGIACYKALDLIRRLQDKGSHIECVLTSNAQEFVKVITFESLLGKKVKSNLFTLDQEKNMNHIKLANDAEIILVAPCTANFISKISNGVADDLATNIMLASNKPKVVAPAMNTNMWENKAVKNNINTLKKIGISIFSPQSGKLACRTEGKGKLMDVDLIVDNLNLFFSEKKLNGRSAIVTAGPSIEKIDPIRYIGNFSSGLQGYEIAETLSFFGAKTVLISGPTKLSPPPNVELISVESSDEFLKKSIEKLPTDIYVSVAAISDWKAKKISKNKLKKKSTDTSFDFKLSKDILRSVSTHKKRPKLVIGFSAETENLIRNSKKKFQIKQCDWMIANKVTEKNGFKSDKNKVFFIDNNNIEEWKVMTKKFVAIKLVKKIVSFFKNYKL
ncbi:MAG: bifunctional phosphopantothenoylcysteine decarboxylase/phosphopantothenate--cysteine ligase CoaBC [Rickettsiales bacterium]|nr:bifunctional phosphopantothenoylcysteine decarboxylase/phosphopantothenate--cysteine ligase CoaBC [Rickettsiales bacterium]